MAQTTPVDIVRQASTLSILWGVLLIVFGMVAIGSPLLAAVAVNVLIAWLIVLAGVVHIMLAFRAHGAGSMISDRLRHGGDWFATSCRRGGQRAHCLAHRLSRRGPHHARLSRAWSGQHDL